MRCYGLVFIYVIMQSLTRISGLRGIIPSELGMLTALTALYLDDCGLTSGLVIETFQNVWFIYIYVCMYK